MSRPSSRRKAPSHSGHSFRRRAFFEQLETRDLLTSDITLSTTNDPSTTLSESTPTVSKAFLFHRTGTLGAIDVNYSVTGPATEGNDWQNNGGDLNSGVVHFGSGVTDVSVSIKALDNDIYDGNRRVYVTLASGTGYTIGTAGSKNILITDNDSAPTVRIANAAGLETAAFGIPFALQISGATDFDVDFTFHTSTTYAGTATSGVDYVARPAGTATLDGGTTLSKTVYVVINDDSTAEGDETFAVDLDTAKIGGTNLTITDARGVGTIYSSDHAPTNIALSSSSVAENLAAGSTVGTLSTTDSDSHDTATYTLVSGTGSTDNASFQISGSTLQTNAVFNYETKSSYSIRVRSTDPDGLYFEKVFTISVTNAPESPTDISVSSSTVAENSASATTIGTLSSTDQDAGDTFTYTLVSGTGSTDNASFQIVGSTLKTNAVFDYETKNSYSIRVRTTDSGSLTYEKVFTISVSNVNEAPTVTITPASYTATEQTNLTLSGTGISLADVDVGSGTMSMDLSVNEGTLTVAAGTTGATVTNSGTATVTVTGTLTQLNNLLAGSSGASVTYLDSLDDPQGDVLFVSVSDQGNSGTGGTQVGSNSVVINVSAVNDAPAANIYLSSYSATEQTPLLLSTGFLYMTVGDTDNEGHDLVVTLSAGQGIFNVDRGTLGATVANSGTSSVTITGSYSDLTYLLAGYFSASVYYVANSDNPGSSTVMTLSVNDQGNTGSGGAKTGSDTATINITAVNDTPTNISLSASSVAENQSSGTNVGTLSSTDPDTGDTFTYSLVSGTGSTDNAFFQISGSTLQTSASFDYETKNSYSIRVRTTDAGGLTFEKVFSISVTNVNETPTALALSSSSLAENAGTNATVGTFSTTDPDASNTFTYSLVTGTGSTDNSAFTITGSTLTANSSFNFESQTSYSIRVRTTDQGGLWFEQAFTISVTNVNETPTDLALSNSSLAENAGMNATVGTFSSTDPDASNTFTYTLVSGTGSTDNSAFTITGNTLTANSSFNFESQNSYSIRVRTTDQGSLWFEQTFTISVTNVNETPTALTLDDSHVDENAGANATVGNFSTTDPDASNTFTYTLVAGTGSTDNSAFTIAGNALKASASFDRETKSSYDIRVRTTDQGGLWTEQTFTITVDNVNEAPTALTLDATSLAENAGSNATVGNFSTTDPDASNTFTYTLATGTGDTDNSAFTITGNTLTANSSFNFESQNSYSIRVRTTDQGGLWFEQTFTISVTNVNETPTALTLDNSGLAENAGSNATVGSFSTTDPDASNTFTYTLVTGTGSTDNSAFAITGNTLAANSSFNFESQTSYSIRVRTTDQGGLWFEQAFTISVTNVNETPTDLALSNSSLAENAGANATVGTFSTTDPDASNTFTYTLVIGTGDTDNSAFTITGNTLTANSSFNFESQTSYSIRVRTTDQGGLWFEQTFSISVTNVNETPTALTLDNSSLAENAGSNATVGSFSTTDLDASNTFTYTLVTGTGSTDNSAFTIIGNTLTANSSFNYESQSSYSIRVRTTDQGGLWSEQVFTISVTNVNEAPTALSLDDSHVDENAGASATVGNFSTTDPDASNTFTYTLVTGTGDTDNSAFSISGNTLQANSSFNFESQNTYSIRVRTTDQGSLTSEQTFTITVNNVNEAPTALTLDDSSLAENAGTNATVGSFSTTDPDASNTFTYSLVTGTGSTDNSAFTITGNTLTANSSFNYESQSSYSIRVRTTDQGGLWSEQTFTISVTNVNETPTALTLDNSDVDEDAAVSTTVGNFSTTDPDAGNTFTYTLVAGTGDTDNSDFTITGNTLKTDATLDFEGRDSYSIRVRTTDQGDAWFEQVLTINVTDLGPSGISLSSNTIDEDQVGGATVGTLTSTDGGGDAGTVTYTLVAGTGDTDNATFEIDGDTLKLATGVTLDYETQTSYSIRVRVTDVNALAHDEVLTVDVNNLDDEDPILSIDNDSILSRQAPFTTIGALSAIDPDDGFTDYTFTLDVEDAPADNDLFAIDQDNGTLVSLATFDFDPLVTFTIEVGIVGPDGTIVFAGFLEITVVLDDQPRALVLERQDGRSDMTEDLNNAGSQIWTTSNSFRTNIPSETKDNIVHEADAETDLDGEEGTLSTVEFTEDIRCPTAVDDTDHVGQLDATVTGDMMNTDPFHDSGFLLNTSGVVDFKVDYDDPDTDLTLNAHLWAFATAQVPDPLTGEWFLGNVGISLTDVNTGETYTIFAEWNGTDWTGEEVGPDGVIEEIAGDLSNTIDLPFTDVRKDDVIRISTNIHLLGYTSGPGSAHAVAKTFAWFDVIPPDDM